MTIDVPSLGARGSATAPTYAGGLVSVQHVYIRTFSPLCSRVYLSYPSPSFTRASPQCIPVAHPSALSWAQPSVQSIAHQSFAYDGGSITICAGPHVTLLSPLRLQTALAGLHIHWLRTNYVYGCTLLYCHLCVCCQPSFRVHEHARLCRCLHMNTALPSHVWTYGRYHHCVIYIITISNFSAEEESSEQHTSLSTSSLHSSHLGYLSP